MSVRWTEVAAGQLQAARDYLARTSPGYAQTLAGRITLLGLIGQIDPPRDEVKDAVARCRAAGIRTVILPKRNERDIDDIPEEACRELLFVFADRMEEVLDAALSPYTAEPPAAASNSEEGDMQVQSADEVVGTVL